jgi:hypothetical protein
MVTTGLSHVDSASSTVSNSENSPAVIASYFPDTLEELKIQRSHRFFRYNGTERVSGLKCFMFGKYVANQRLESYKGLLRRQRCTGGFHFSRILLISTFRYNKSCTH